MIRKEGLLSNGHKKIGLKNKSPTKQCSVGLFSIWWPGGESNSRHKDFQSSALPTELPGQKINYIGVFKKCEVFIELFVKNTKFKLVISKKVVFWLLALIFYLQS